MAAKNILPFIDKGRIQEEASEWVIKLDGGLVTADQVTELRQWLSQSRTHRASFKQLVKLWGNLDVLQELSDVIQQDAVSGYVQAFSEVKTAGKFFANYNTRYMVAACLALVCTGFLLFSSIGVPWVSGDHPDSRVYMTAKGSLQTVALPDGSIVKLNTDSRIKLDFTKETRSIRLVRGEAHFEVAHNPERPFIVHVADGSVRAVGTAFNVRYQREKVDVIVTEGRVEVASSVTPDRKAKADVIDEHAKVTASPVKLAVSAGHKVTFDEQQIRAVESVAPKVIERKLAWREGMLLFEGDPLVDAITEVSRYTDTKIIITNAELKKLRVGGYFKIGEIDAMLAVFEQTFGIKVTRMGNSLVYLSKQSTPPQG